MAMTTAAKLAVGGSPMVAHLAAERKKPMSQGRGPRGGVRTSPFVRALLRTRSSSSTAFCCIRELNLRPQRE
jgi:hypothetical protein